ncbi:B-cell linker protein-like isoform X5 [Ostrea edulis]|uniref:B-cell linker protein-like isoform X5 n=1 Tax=Ostrea edulis TaxID=37623 RepID=UPI0024AE8D70|nr:B-cell linker protein-like isoform X5 [Ostrea edulis]
MNKPRRQLPIPDGDAPKSGRPPPPTPSSDDDAPPPVPGRRPPPPVPEPEKPPPRDPLEHSDSSYESDSDFDADSDESYEKMRDKLSPPAIPNRGYRQQTEDLHSPMFKQRSSRPPPPGRSHDSSRPPPPGRMLPNLPPISAGKREVPQPPAKPDDQEVYDDGEAGDIYDEEVGIGPEDVYDDGEIGQEVYNELEEDMPPPIPAAPRRNLPPPPPQTGRPLPPPVQDDVYEVEPEPDPIRPQTTPEESGESIYEMEPVVSDQPSKPPPQLPNRPAVAPPPQETYEIQDDEQENYDEFDVADQQETYDEFEQGSGEVYEDLDENETPKPPGRSVPPPPPVPAMLSHKPTPPPPKSKAPPASKPAPKPPIGGGPGGIDLSAITAVKLKKVGVPKDDRPKVTESDKIYDEGGDVKSAFEKFKMKESNVNQVDFRSLLSKPKLSPKDIGIKLSSANPAATTAHVPPVSKWGQIRNQDMQSSGALPVPKSSAAVATSLKKSVSQGKPDLHPRPAKIPEITNTTPTSPVTKSTPSLPKPRSPSPSKDLPPPPPSIKSVPDKPPAVPYTQVKPNTNVTNGNKLGIQEDHISSEEDEDDDIYDDAISNRDPLLGEPWYFKSLKDRKTGDKLLRKVGKDGTFLIRESTKQGNFQPYTMMVLYQNSIYNLKIRVRSDGKMALGEEKPDEMSFMDVQKLVKYHRETEVILVGNTGQHKTLLKYSPPHN